MLIAIDHNHNGHRNCNNHKDHDENVNVDDEPYPQNIELPIKIIAINCQLKLIAGLEKRQLIVVSPTII
jgi:hypothetical protein